MAKINRISDEELAAYLEGLLSENDSETVKTAMDFDTFEVLNVSRKAIDGYFAENVISLPSWDNIDSASIHPIYKPLAMAGFLGDCSLNENADEGTDEGEE